MTRNSKFFILKLFVWTAVMIAAALFINDYSNSAVPTLENRTCLKKPGQQVWIEGGEFIMGDNNGYPEEGPQHKVRIDGFWIDTHEVTNAQFAEFVEQTGYVTVAERKPNVEDFPGAPEEMLKPGSVLFTPPNEGGQINNWWSYVPGTNWKHPHGPGSTIQGKEHLPVVHVAFADAQAYADWAGRKLPTEAQFEFAARNKKQGQQFSWEGDELAPEGEHRANTWQGIFPLQNSEKDGFVGLAPVGCFKPNDYGVYDLIGNVWEWTASWYAPRHDPADNLNPQGVAKENSYDRNNAGFPVKVIKGGSYLCAPNYCMRYRPAARHAQDVGLGTSHIGFRTVLNQS